MRQGELRQRISFQQKIEITDSNGFVSSSFEDYLNAKEFWASVMYPKGRETVEEHSVRNRVDIKVKMRYNPNIVPTMKLVYKNVEYNIETVLPDSKTGNYYMMINAYTGVNEG
jgi:SPP1 family predicted phage head-tail adaptor